MSRFRAWIGGSLLLIAGTAVIGLCGCSSTPSQLGDKKEDWAKTAPPPQWHGPGQPGGPSGPSGPGKPPAGELNGPATPVPASVKGAAGK